ncbi:MAG: hypothetical protein JWP59_3443 [Massilia sp.]|jgi:uncharacterized short protein YbdD (DUF466 family)|nr:hypothetical protein [Massilia sp.]
MLNALLLGELAARCAGVADAGGKFGKYLGQSLRLMVGLPDYERYVAHIQAAHPGQAVMSYEEFFRERQQARYGNGKQGGCC